MLEIETKIVDIHIPAIKKQFALKKVKFLGRVRQKKFIFFNKEPDNEFIRVRTDGKKSTLTYKFRKNNKSLRNMIEIETDIESFEKTAEILSKLIKNRVYDENIRWTYKYKDVEIAINKWPVIPTFMEIEGPSVKSIRDCIKELRIEGKVIGNISMVKRYEYYGENIRDCMPKKFKDKE